MRHTLRFFMATVIGAILMGITFNASAQEIKNQDDLIVLCYHDIPKEIYLDNFGVDQETFVNTIEYFRVHHFHFVSLDDVIQAEHGTKALPSKAILLTFDDAYATYYDFVFPLLQEYQIPSVLAVVSGWLDKTPFGNASLSFIGRNLLIFTPSSNHFIDPELTTFGNDLNADYGEFSATPTTRSYGVSLRITF